MHKNKWYLVVGLVVVSLIIPLIVVRLLVIVSAVVIPYKNTIMISFLFFSERIV